MLPLKLVHSLVSGTALTNPLLRIPLDDDNDNDEDEDDDVSPQSRIRVPLMLFVPTHELVSDTYRLAAIARQIGMDLHPNPSLSHLIFSWPPPPSSSSSFSASSSSSSSSSSSFTYSWSLPNDSVPIPFPSFAAASLSNLRLFAAVSKGYFKLAFLKSTSRRPPECLSNNNLNCTSLRLYSTRTAERVNSMDGLTRALLGTGWTLFRTAPDSPETAVYLYRKMEVSRRRVVNGNGNWDCSRVRELRLPPLDFRNPPLRILQYILLMSDDVFYLA
ncbi:uncharacterized protein LOC127258018 [Andrographis paniculata]|uniref:uncharacterized protein LOC127258018 n=1 Tax=Andrographis paniculata TaxID=175694 RepID=UPI0021E76607|nr:uncharacterized protein LOC127258018 [Andrographis paniculata]